MRKLALLGVSALGLVFNANSGHASYGGSWCARFSGGSDYYENCTMNSFAMCLGEIRGTGGNTICSPNPRMGSVAPAQLRRKH